MSDPIRVACAPDGSDGFRCRVEVGDDPGATSHEVRVDAATLAELAPGHAEPSALVRASFAFLLEREPRGSILRSFDLPVIERYFPGYTTTIRKRVGRETR